ncbi:MAG: DUF2628 domain-containing protein [Xanthobacteraceae bacterium]
MAIYTVFEPQIEENDPTTHATQFAFVRDGFSWGAFIFGLIWMLWHRLWLVSFLFAILVGAIAAVAATTQLPTGVMIVVWLLLKLLVGLEASTLRRWTLQRRRWRDMGTVVADNLQMAERRFFDHWVGVVSPPPFPGSATNAPARADSAPTGDAGPDVIGLFPRPGGQR